MTSMADVARAAGVSVATVSRVLSGKPGVRPETTARIRETAEALGYTYNSLAASLRRQRTMLVGVCVPQVTNPFFAALIEGIENEVSTLGFDVLVADSQEDPAKELARVSSLVERQVDALVLVPTGGDGVVRLLDGKVPTVLVDRDLPGLAADRIGVDHRAGIEATVAHLHARGHRHLGYLGAGVTNTAAGERAAAFRAIDGGPCFEGRFTMQWGREGLARLRADHPEVTAVVCANDMVAFGAISAAREHGLTIPDDLAVTGFDDLPFAELVQPALTTVRQPLGEITAAAARSLSRRLGDLPAGPATGDREAARAPSSVEDDGTTDGDEATVGTVTRFPGTLIVRSSA